MTNQVIKLDAPRWIKNNDTEENEEIILGEEELWALRNGYNAGTLKNFLFGRTKLFPRKILNLLKVPKTKLQA